jgi:hypothetical protein
MQYENLYIQRHATDIQQDFQEWKDVITCYEEALRNFVSEYMENRSRKYLLQTISELAKVIHEETGSAPLLLEELPIEIRTKIKNV